jgi:hypothetical protein
MKNLIKSKIFIVTFLMTYFSFFAFTIWIFEVKRDGVGVGHTEYGYPFIYFRSHCFGGSYDFQGLIGNIFFAFGLSFFVGLFFSHFWLKFSSPEFRQKWHLNW